jgi:hypothetical protein
LVNTCPRLASATPFCRLIFAHLECPDIAILYTILPPQLLKGKARYPVSNDFDLLC